MALTYRTTENFDLAILNDWTSKDIFHKETLTGGYWLQPVDKDKQPRKGIKCIAVTDESGKPLFYLRLETVMRAMIQFPPESERNPNMKAHLEEAFWFIVSNAKTLGFQEMIFDSVSKPLVNFFSSYGFKPMENHYKVTL